LGGSLIVRECTLPQSVEPLIKMGRDAEPALLRIVEPRRQDTDEQVYEAFLANKCAMLVTSPKVTRWDTKTNAATGMVLVVYAFDTTPKEGWTLDRALRWVKITALRLVGQD
jgi:hypothetical protein